MGAPSPGVVLRFCTSGRTLTAWQYFRNFKREGCTKAGKGGSSLSNLKDKVKDKIDDAADSAKKTASKVIDKSKELADKAGKTMEKGGKRLQDA
jgi:hypothetical protein